LSFGVGALSFGVGDVSALSNGVGDVTLLNSRTICEFALFYRKMGLGDLKNWLVELLPPGYRACETYSTPYD
jgi:hypothetical protein